MHTYKYLIIILLFCLTSCKAKQVLVSSIRTEEKLITEQKASEKKDSIRISEHYRDQDITIPGDSLKVVLPIETNDNGKLIPASFEVHGERSGLKIDVSEGSIMAIATCDEYQAKIKVLERTVESYKEETTSLSTTIQTCEKEISVLKEQKTALQKILDGIKRKVKTGIIIATVIIVLTAAFKYAKPILSIIKKLFQWQKTLF